MSHVDTGVDMYEHNTRDDELDKGNDSLDGTGVRADVCEQNRSGDNGLVCVGQTIIASESQTVDNLCSFLKETNVANIDGGGGHAEYSNVGVDVTIGDVVVVDVVLAMMIVTSASGWANVYGDVDAFGITK